MSKQEKRAAEVLELTTAVNELLSGDGLVGYVQRLRSGHWPRLTRGAYGGCVCGDIGCRKDLLLLHIENLRVAYELKVEDFARETQRNEVQPDVPMSHAEKADLQRAYSRDVWAGEFNSVPTAVGRILAARDNSTCTCPYLNPSRWISADCPVHLRDDREGETVTEAERLALYIEEQARQFVETGKTMGLPFDLPVQAKHAGYMEAASMIRTAPADWSPVTPDGGDTP